MNQAEKTVLLFIANLLATDKTAIETDSGPILLTVENGAVKIADGVFAKIPMGLGGLLNGALAGYVASYGTEADLESYEGAGIDALVALLEKIANGLPA